MKTTKAGRRSRRAGRFFTKININPPNGGIGTTTFDLLELFQTGFGFVASDATGKQKQAPCIGDLQVLQGSVSAINIKLYNYKHSSDSMRGAVNRIWYI
ncbi:hypothetical protein CHELA40_11053 [Chelatococcus asaccharovorans]|nr:hypothetical protein CHELA40_11053 [Chelatococcus asaccharovorans]CAH1685513.1 hypothetical protein CHELA17_64544 [Chelatococcus asaccharovorans]